MAPVSTRKLIFLPATSSHPGSSVEIKVLVWAGANLLPGHPQSSSAATATGDDPFPLWEQAVYLRGTRPWRWLSAFFCPVSRAFAPETHVMLVLSTPLWLSWVTVRRLATASVASKS